MKTIATWQSATPYGLAILRIATVLSFWQHPSAKFLHVPYIERLAQIDPLSLVAVGGVIEVACGLLILLGCYTRIAAFILSGEMAVAYFIAHAPRGFFPVLNGGEACYLYCFIFLLISMTGPGKLALTLKTDDAPMSSSASEVGVR